MIKQDSKRERNKRRHARVRKKISGTGTVPRLAVCKSNKHIYAQLIDDVSAKTLAFYSTNQSSVKSNLKATWTKEAAKKIGELVAKSALQKGIKKVVFDRGGNKYHGKILEFAEAARACGLEF